MCDAFGRSRCLLYRTLTLIQYCSVSLKLPGAHMVSVLTPFEFVLASTDGYPLAASLWKLNSDNPRAAAIINAGAGIGMRYYYKFAQFLASNGIATLLYDYRGIGRSRPLRLRGFKASVEDWGSKDCAVALGWLSTEFPGVRRVAIGHSVGGFVTGFVTNGHLIDRLLLVGAHTGYWRDYAPASRVGMYLLWHTLMPAITHVVGYFPGRMLHLIDDLPANVALEWANRRRPEFWWNKLTPEGLVDTEWKENALRRFAAISAPILAIQIADDVFFSEAATARVLGLYSNCSATTVKFTPSDIGAKRIGHFGFFRQRCQELWPRTAKWLLD